MPFFSQASKDKLSTCHPALQLVCAEVVKHFNCTVACGHRNEADQNRAFDEGKSKLRWPHGNHNKTPSMAVDLVPWPIDWDDHKSMLLFAGFVLGTATQLGIQLRWGGDWDRDWDLKDNRFNDYPHFELHQE